MARAVAVKILENTVDTVAREVLVALQRVLTGAAIGAARTASRLGAIAQRHERMEEGARAVQDVTAKMRAEIELAAEAATQTASASERVTEIAREGRRLSGQSMDSMQKLLQHSDVTNDRLASLLRRVREVAGVSRLIEDIASRTRLLALNASIEATRARRPCRRGRHVPIFSAPIASSASGRARARRFSSRPMPATPVSSSPSSPSRCS